MWVSIEGGGTKHRVHVWPREALEAGRPAIPDAPAPPIVNTARPAETIYEEIVAQIRDSASEPVTAIGVATFGPVVIDPASPDYGLIHAPQKSGGQFGRFNVHAFLKRCFPEAAIRVDNDANANARAELRYGVGLEVPGTRSVYVLINGGGTGGAFGFVPAGHREPQILTGQAYDPEPGSLLLQVHPDDPGLRSAPFRERLYRGSLARAEDLLAHASFLRRPAGLEAKDLPAEDPTWSAVEDYLGQLVNQVLTLFAPDAVVLCGGIAQSDKVSLDRIAEGVVTLNRSGGGGFIGSLQEVGPVRRRLHRSALGNDIGVYGALMLAREAERMVTT